jgi:hypothetical protein
MKNCGNCANYDRSKMQHTDVCGTCVKCETKYTNWKPIPMTHGDQIRAMSDKELANLLASKMANIKELEMAEKGIRVTATQLSLLASRLHDIWLQWLRAPAEDS